VLREGSVSVSAYQYQCCVRKSAKILVRYVVWWHGAVDLSCQSQVRLVYRKWMRSGLSSFYCTANVKFGLLYSTRPFRSAVQTRRYVVDRHRRGLTVLSPPRGCINEVKYQPHHAPPHCCAAQLNRRRWHCTIPGEKQPEQATDADSRPADAIASAIRPETGQTTAQA